MSFSPRMQQLKSHIAAIPDFPKPGILFRDISPLLRHELPATLHALDELVGSARWAAIDAIAGIESRGFILAAGLAALRQKGFVPIRKQGKLPPPVVDVAYALEYGTGVLEMQTGAGRLLVIDDVLATGGTLRAAADLAVVAGYSVSALVVLIDLRICADFVWCNLPAESVLQYG